MRLPRLATSRENSAIAIRRKWSNAMPIEMQAASMGVAQEQCPHPKIDVAVCGATPDPPSGARTIHLDDPSLDARVQRWACSWRARPPGPVLFGDDRTARLTRL